MIYGSVCSGIEAASVAWHPLGWRAAFLSEIEAFPRAVLAHHYPSTPLHGDFTTIKAGEYDPIDLLVGGTPCQSFSVAGLRGGLDDERGNLALEYLRLADRLRPRWLVWENVPGVLSSNGGRDFGAILGGMVELGYGFAYRVLDAQFFGVAQRRRRVFVVGYLGDWRRAAAVLFERHCLQGHPTPRREKGQRSARPIAAGSQRGSGYRNDADTADNLITNALGGGQISHALTARHSATGRYDPNGETWVAHALRGGGFDASEDGTGRGTPIVPVAFNGRMDPVCGDVPGALDTDPMTQCVAFALRGREGGAMPEIGGERASALRAATGGSSRDYIAFNITPSDSNKDYNARASDRAQAVTAGGNRPSARGGDLIAFAENQRNEVRELGVAGALAGIRRGDAKNETLLAMSAVRRLTPLECERLQGFPDDYTRIPWNGWRAMDATETPDSCREQGIEIRQTRKGNWRVKDVDGPRYKALGNSMAVPCMAWIGRRIAMVDSLQLKPEVA